MMIAGLNNAAVHVRVMKKNILARAKKHKIAALLQENNLIEAKQLCEQIFKTNRTDVEILILLATIYRELGNYSEAEAACRKALELHPKFAEAHHTLGAILQCRGKIQDALNYYKSAIQLKPDFTEAYYFLANTLRESGLLEQAVEYYRITLRLNPNHVAALCNLGGTLTGLHKFDEAALHLNKANRLRPGTAPVLCNIARILQLLGNPKEAEARCREALYHNPNAVDALVMLAELLEKSSRLTETRELVERGLKLAPNHAGLRFIEAKLARRENRHQDAITIAETALTANPTADKKAELHYLLGQLYDHLGEANRAFLHFLEANHISARAVSGADSHIYLRRVEKRRELFRAALPILKNETADSVGSLSKESPVFLVGFPRSGTTLLEQILDSHPLLRALDERPAVEVMLKTYDRIVTRRSDAVTALAESEIKELREAYFNEVNKWLKYESGQILVDKQPLNLIDAYFIWRVFPNAKFIFAMRHPCDVCLSCFMQNFALNEAITTFTNLEATAATYASVMELWLEYVRHLPLQYHMIRYEDLVENMENETRRLLSFLNIAWNDGILNHADHAKQRGMITTPSYHQVTQPIYKNAKFRWKRYAQELKPVMQTLQPFIEHFGYGNIDNENRS